MPERPRDQRCGQCVFGLPVPSGRVDIVRCAHPLRITYIDHNGPTEIEYTNRVIEKWCVLWKARP